MNSKAVARNLCILSLAVFISAGVLSGVRPSFAQQQTAYNNLQVYISPQNTNFTSFSVTVYNSTGGVVATSQSSLPALSFELLNGNYLLVATAGSPNYYPVPIAQNSASSVIVNPIIPVYQQEYGFSQVNLNSSETVTVTTSDLQNIQTSQLTVVAKYENGTVAQGASIYASVLGGGGYYYPGSSLSMSNTTDSSGQVTLTVPDIPIQLTAWSWVPINLPSNQTTTTVTVGGEPVNVTVMWEPTYLGLAASTVIVPPFHETTLTLKPQQQSFWAYPAGVASTGSGVASPGLATSGEAGTLASAPSAVPANVLQEQQGGSASSGVSSQRSTPSEPSTVTVTTVQSTVSSSTSVPSNQILEGGMIAAIIVSIAAVVLAVRRK